MYVTDPTCSRVGTQCWVYGAIMVTEALLCIRHGAALFERTQALNILLWLLCQSLVSVLCVYGCVLWHRYFEVCVYFFKMKLEIIHFVTNCMVMFFFFITFMSSSNAFCMALIFSDRKESYFKTMYYSTRQQSSGCNP